MLGLVVFILFGSVYFGYLFCGLVLLWVCVVG